MYYMLLEFFAAATVLIPVFLLLWKIKFYDFKTTVYYTCFAIYLSAVYHLTGMPTIQFMVWDINLNLIPFIGMIADFKNTVLNVILFIPLGILLPFLWEKYRAMKNTLLFGFGMTLAIELLQLLTLRASDINDIIANTAGTITGYLLFAAASKRVPLISRQDGRKSGIYIVFLIVIAVMFFVQPVIVSFIFSIT